jgi:hypothetical protein
LRKLGLSQRAGSKLGLAVRLRNRSSRRPRRDSRRHTVPGRLPDAARSLTGRERCAAHEFARAPSMGGRFGSRTGGSSTVQTRLAATRAGGMERERPDPGILESRGRARHPSALLVHVANLLSLRPSCRRRNHHQGLAIRNIHIHIHHGSQVVSSSHPWGIQLAHCMPARSGLRRDWLQVATGMSSKQDILPSGCPVDQTLSRGCAAPRARREPGVAREPGAGSGADLKEC